MRKGILRVLIGTMFVTALWACGSKSSSDATLTAITVTPANSLMAVNASQQFIATGTFSDNSTQIITNPVTWTSSDTNIATISNAGVVTAVAVGSATIKATSGSISGTTGLTVHLPTSAVVKLSTAGTLPTGKKIGAIDVTLTLASGVTLKSTLTPTEPDPGVVTASGVAASNSLIAAHYTAPTSTLPGKLQIGVINVGGFGTGEFVTINGDIAAGLTPRATDFSVTLNSVADTDTNPLAGLTAGIAVDLR